MKIIRKISSVLNHLMGYITFIAFFVIMIFIVLNVIMRYIFEAPILGAYEIVEQMMFVGVFCSFAYAQQEGSHIRVAMILAKLPHRAAMVICSITGLLGAGILAALSCAAYKQFAMAMKFDYTTAMLKFAQAPFYALEIVCCIVFALAVLVDTAEYIIAVFNKDKADEIAKKFI